MTVVSLKAVLIVLLCLPLFLCACSHAVAPAAQRETDRFIWSVDEAPPLPGGRGGHAAGLVNGMLVVAGGNSWSADRTKKAWHDDTILRRDGRWVSGPSLPHPMAHPAFAPYRSGLIVAGGADGSAEKSMRRTALSVVPAGDSIRIEPLPDLPVALSAAACGVVGSVAYVVGGEAPSGLSAAMWSLDLKHPEKGWRERPALPAAGRAFSAVLSDDHSVYVLGGLSEWQPLTSLPDAFRYDTRSDKWEKLPDLPVKGYAWSAAWVDSRRFLLAGRAAGEIFDDIWLIHAPDMTGDAIGRTVIQTTTAPLVRTGEHEWLLLGGEPDSNKTRTPRVTRISALIP